MLDRLLGSGWGSIEITPTTPVVDPGEALEGIVTVEAKQAIGPGLLTVTLVCERRDDRTVSSLRGSGGRRTGAMVGVGVQRQRRTRVLWKRTIVVASDVVLDAKSKQTFEFSVDVPTITDPADDPNLSDWARSAMAIVDALSPSQRELAWKLQARFKHRAGFDLRCSERVVVNPPAP